MKKTLEQQIRLVMEGQANAGVLEYGSDIARDTYSKDTPGQTPGIDHSPEQHQHKPNLALDGVPVPGGQLKKPNFEKDAGMGKVAEAKEMKGKNCGCGKDPCETYGSKEEQMKEANIDEAGRWDATSQGKAYRRLSPEEKARKAKANEVMRRAKTMKGKAKASKQGIGKLKSVYKGTRLQRNDVMSDLIADLEMAYLGEAMSDSERKQAAAKIFRMHQAKQAAKQANAALGKKSDPAAKAARRDSASYKTSDDSHLDSKPKAPEKKRGRGERDLPHIVSQLRGVVDTKDGKPSAVKFKDGTTKNVKPKHAAAWLKKHDSAKPADKLSMYKSHDSHSSFKSYAKESVDEGMMDNIKDKVKASPLNMNTLSRKRAQVKVDLKKRLNKMEAVDKDDTEVLKKLSKDLKGSMKAHGKQKKALDKAINEGSINELSGKTLSNYIQKAANPVKKNSAVNLASRGGYKLGSSAPHDLDAGEKEDRKAYNRGQGMQRAAIKLQKKMYGKKTDRMSQHASESVVDKYKKLKKGAKKVANVLNKMNQASYSNVKKMKREENNPVMEAMKNVYGEAWFDTASYPTHKDHRKKTADRKTADALNSPNTLKKRQQMHPAHRKAYDAKVRQNNYDKHGVGSKKETTPLDKKLHHPDVKAP